MLVSRVCELCRVSKYSSEYNKHCCRHICVDCLERRYIWLLEKIQKNHSVYFDDGYIQPSITMYFDRC